MPNFPMFSNALPSVYGYSNHEFYYNDTHLVIFYCGGDIILRKGTWHEAAIAMLGKILISSNDLVVYGKIQIDTVTMEMSLLPIPVGPLPNTDNQISEEKYKAIEEEYKNRRVELKKNFLILKENFDKVKNLKVFW